MAGNACCSQSSMAAENGARLRRGEQEDNPPDAHLVVDTAPARLSTALLPSMRFNAGTSAADLDEQLGPARGLVTGSHISRR